MNGAVLYIRVSTKEQTDNMSLPTQLKACEDYCARHGYAVVATFREEGESAKTADRTELQRMLSYCRTQKGRVGYVVVYSLSRFAREKYDHFALRAHLMSLGITLRSATEPIDDTSTGKLMEGILAAVAQHDNDVRSERVRAGMKAALEMGRWTFLAPLGYLNAPKSLGTSLIADPDRAPLVQRVFDEFSSGRHTKDDVRQRINAAGLRTRRGRPIPSQTFDDLLINRVYVGWLDVPDFGINRRGDFDPLVQESTFYRVQGILAGRLPTVAPAARSNADFPLRGFVRCLRCEKPITGSWSKGRNGYHAYYHCQGRCRAVNISKAALETQFVDALTELQPSAGFMRLVKEHVLVAWRTLQADARATAATAERRVRQIQERLDRLDDAFLFAQSIDQNTYARQRDRMREELTLARMNQHGAAIDELDVEGILAFAEAVLPSAARIWSQASLMHRQRLQRVFFSQGLAFDGKRLHRTAASIPFINQLRVIQGAKSGMVDQTGASWNQVTTWLRSVDELRRIAA